MKRFFLVCFTLAIGGYTALEAGILYESATMMEEVVGVPKNVGVLSIQPVGSRFHLDTMADISAVGGNFMRHAGSFYAVIVELTAPQAFPIGSPSGFQNVVTYTTFENEKAVQDDFIDMRIPLQVTLEPGDYALIFGSGLFGVSNGMGAMGYENQAAYPEASNFSWSPTSGWKNRSDPLRFIVEGQAVPEPSSLLLLALGTLTFRKYKTRSS